ncbi:MAG TPA: hypothetical protein VF526_00600 [Solirubrobacteraceae bacterium]
MLLEVGVLLLRGRAVLAPGVAIVEHEPVLLDQLAGVIVRPPVELDGPS